MTETLTGRYQRARMFFDAGDFITAAAMLADVLTAAPRDGSVRLLLARAYYHSAQLTRAETELRRLVDDYPDDQYAHLLLGRTLQRQSRHTAATPHLRLAEAMQPAAPGSRTRAQTHAR